MKRSAKVRMKHLMLIIALLVTVPSMAQQKAITLNEGEIIPDFTVIGPKGNKMKILKIASKSKYTLIDFWASWCSPCREEFPKLKEVYGSFHKEGFNVLGIAIGDKQADWTKALAEENTTWLQGRDVDYAIQKKLDVSGVPSYLLIDHKGKLIAASLFTNTSMIQFGPAIRGAKGLQETLEKLLKQ